jgi:hypothetical protein
MKELVAVMETAAGRQEITAEFSLDINENPWYEIFVGGKPWKWGLKTIKECREEVWYAFGDKIVRD